MALHVLVLVLLLLLSATAMLHSAPPVKKEVDVVFYRPPQLPVPARPVTAPTPRGKGAVPAPGAPAPALKPRLEAAPGPDGPGTPELPAGPEEGRPVETPQP
ncbi:MAG TPA: hypothetical protein VFV95_14015 [Vicinamibacterales bacterium]|nr:hypothetical protein [Vicinamibacterales bacterium]